MIDPMSNPPLPERTGDYSEAAGCEAIPATLAERLKPFIDNPYISPSHKLLKEIYAALSANG